MFGCLLFCNFSVFISSCCKKETVLQKLIERVEPISPVLPVLVLPWGRAWCLVSPLCDNCNEDH